MGKKPLSKDDEALITGIQAIGASIAANEALRSVSDGRANWQSVGKKIDLLIRQAFIQGKITTYIDLASDRHIEFEGHCKARYNVLLEELEATRKELKKLG